MYILYEHILLILLYWTEKIKTGGVLFLYLPHYSQTYWRPWNNRKHVNALNPQLLNDYYRARDYKQPWCTGADLNNSFYAVAVK